MAIVWSNKFTFDPDAAAYISAVEAADEAASPGIGALETGVRYAINDFVRGCKQDGIWSAIKASCILAGARTLDGALVPLVGTAPTNYNFVAGDYNRETGLVGNGSTKYLDSNRNHNADPQNNAHVSAYATVVSGDLISFGSETNLLGSGSRLKSSTFTSYTASAPTFLGIARANATDYLRRVNGVNSIALATSSAPNSGNLFVFARNNSGSAVNFSLARLAFYSIGESLDLGALDGRVTDLVNAIGAAIP